METTSPARLARQKRLSNEHDDSDNDISCQSACWFFWTHSSVLFATFIIAWVWFARVVAPLAGAAGVPAEPAPCEWANDAGLFMATGSPGLANMHAAFSAPSLRPSPVTEQLATRGDAWTFDDFGLTLAIGSPWLGRSMDRSASSAPAVAKASSSTPASVAPMSSADEVRAFVLTCALVHTLLVGVGLAFGADSHAATAYAGSATAAARMLALVGGASFLLLCLCLSVSWELQVGPVPSYAARIFSHSKASFVLIGALSATGWLGGSALLETTALGRAWTRSTPLLALTALAGGATLLLEASVAVSLVCIAISLGSAGAAAAWVAGHEAHRPRYRSWVRQALCHL